MKTKNSEKNTIEITLSMLDTRWKPLIIKELLTGTKRFGELKTAVGNITQKVLTANLRNMEEKGLVKRTVYKQIPPRVDYTLTDIGYSLAGVLDAMADWGGAYSEYVKLLEKQNKKTAK